MQRQIRPYAATSYAQFAGFGAFVRLILPKRCQTPNLGWKIDSE